MATSSESLSTSVLSLLSKAIKYLSLVVFRPSKRSLTFQLVFLCSELSFRHREVQLGRIERRFRVVDE